MQIGRRKIGKNQPCFIIAEIGTTHNGNLEKAFKLIDSARRAGADCVKFQMVFADEIIHPKAGLVSLPGGNIDLYRKFKQLERDQAFYQKLKQYAIKNDLVFLCTPYGIKSARILRDMRVTALKIASPELNHFPLLKEVVTYNLPLILSTGISTLGDIENAMSITGKNSILLHCITAYPAPEQEYNLRLLPLLKNIFGVAVGVSDHSLDPVLIPVLSVHQGAAIIEKHFTLDNRGQGLDDPIALTEQEFSQMVKSIRKAEQTNQEKVLSQLKSQYGQKKVEAVLGDGQKRLAPSESKNYLTTRRSICAKKNINNKQILTEKNIALYRSEKNLSPGLSPQYLPIILGRRVQSTIKAGQGITWDDLLF
jgi:sialic acid synthase SpsE